MTLVAAGAVALAWGLVRTTAVGWGSAQVIVALCLGAVLIACFVAWERRVPAPMLPLRLLRIRSFAAANATGFMTMAAITSAAFMMSQFFQVGLGYSPLATGLRFLPWTATPLLIAPVAGRLADRIGVRPLMVLGMAMQAAGLFWVALEITAGVSYGQLVLPLIIAGVGISMAIPTTPTAALDAVPAADMGTASGVQNTLQRFGAVFGVAIVTAVFSASGHLGSAAGVISGIRPALGASAGLSLLGAFAALAAKRRPLRSGEPAITASGAAGELAVSRLARTLAGAALGAGSARLGVERGGQHLGDLMQLRGGDDERRRNLERDPAQQPGEDPATSRGRDDARAECRGRRPSAAWLSSIAPSSPAPVRTWLTSSCRCQRGQRGRESWLEFPDPLYQLLALDDVQVGQRRPRRRPDAPSRCTRAGTSQSSRAARTARRPAARPPRHRAGGSRRSGPSPTVIMSGSSPYRTLPNHSPGPAEAGDDLVGDEQHVVVAADLLDLGQVALGREVDAARADHRLAEERADPVRADLLDDLGERRRVVPRHVLDQRDELAERIGVGGDAAK